MNSRVTSMAVAAVAAFAVLAGWGEDYQMVMADLPDGSPQRLYFTVNFETGELFAGLRSGEARSPRMARCGFLANGRCARMPGGDRQHTSPFGMISRNSSSGRWMR